MARTGNLEHKRYALIVLCEILGESGHPELQWGEHRAILVARTTTTSTSAAAVSETPTTHTTTTTMGSAKKSATKKTASAATNATKDATLIYDNEKVRLHVKLVA